MDEKRFIEIIEANNEKLANLMDKKIEVNNEKLANLIDEKIEVNNEKLANLIDEKIEANNEKLANLIDEKIIANNGRIADFMEMNNEALLLKLDKRFEKIEREIKEIKIKVNYDKAYFEETYGQKDNILFQKVELNERLHAIERKELDKYKKENNERLNSYDVRITNLEKVVNS